MSPLDILVLAIAAFVPHTGPTATSGVVPMYVGPDQILPLTSALGAILGVLLMFWNRVLGMFRRIREFLSRR
jgi:hypothetical protein